jgi:DNA-binding NarL/FixJ family response regulator
MARVLIVEDEWLQAEDVEDLIAAHGHTLCGSVTTGEEAVALAHKERPDVVLMDVHLPGKIDGVEAAARIQAAYLCPIVFVTAYDDARTVKRMRAQQPAAIISKPASGDAILAAIASAAEG